MSLSYYLPCSCYLFITHIFFFFFFFSSRRRHTRLQGDWSSDVCSSDLLKTNLGRRPWHEPAMTSNNATETNQCAPKSPSSVQALPACFSASCCTARA